MNKQVINTSNAPAPIGPYSQAIEANGFLFISGQIPLHAESGELIMDSIEAETEQVMKNLHAILKEAGLTFENVVKTSIFLMDMQQFASVNAVYARYFTENPPARETIQVAGLPKNVHVEISMIAVR
ncbi:MAG: RidA family protein [Bacteroidetes bacterium]|nr:RidA family protein [Bacteroidota bacterium]